MNTYFSKLSMIVWSISAARALLYSLIVTGEAFNAATKVTGLSAMSHDQRVALCVGLFIIQAGVMLAFLDQTIAKLSAPALDAPPAPAKPPQP